ncbi:Glutamate decarboxylase 1 [Larimichthys crocea]|uniref:Uncharacterized protein n=1 Tax=Larimichthys crocea TaxID=215358 RepID=A0ACD3QQX8_LARCR|nr:Glutamate decarboxylase 1 [Larimichthys crocea]
MDFLQRPHRIIDKSAVRDKQQDDSAAGRDRRQTPADFSNIYSKDLLPASHGEELTRGFLQELVNILLEYICKSNQRSSKLSSGLDVIGVAGEWLTSTANTNM